MQEDKIVKRIISYNVENLFDTIHQEGNDDYAFLPNGEMHWTAQRYYSKLQNIARVLSDISGWDDPAIVGLCEVENAGVLRDLLSRRSFRDKPYDYAITNGADSRGINVALLWNTQDFTLIDANEIPAYEDHYPISYYPLGQDPRTDAERAGSGRNALWVTLETHKGHHRLDIFVIHMPSRRFGGSVTEQNRLKVARRIRSVIDKLIESQPDTHIVIMGDFNENPNQPAIAKGLRAVLDYHYGRFKNRLLYNLSVNAWRSGQGSHIFEGRPWMPDQIMVSGNMMCDDKELSLVHRKMKVFKPQYVTVDSFGRPSAVLIPKRTYRGHVYRGGYSDHFPVYIDITY